MTPEHDPWPDLLVTPLPALLVAIERYQFADPQGHALAMCAEFVELKRRAATQQEARDAA